MLGKVICKYFSKAQKYVFQLKSRIRHEMGKILPYRLMIHKSWMIEFRFHAIRPIGIKYSLWTIDYGHYAIHEPSWILIALIGLAPLEENMNPLIFWYQPKYRTMHTRSWAQWHAKSRASKLDGQVDIVNST